jgi:hypothetical protein
MNNMDTDGGRLLAPLRELRPEPDGIDVSAAMRQGRRRYHLMRVAQTASVLGLTAVVSLTAAFVLQQPADRGPIRSDLSPPVGGPAFCTLDTLPSPVPETRALAVAVDPSGRYIIGRVDTDGPNTNGQTPPAIIASGGTRTSVKTAQSWPRHAVIWDNGTPSLIEAPGSVLQLDAVNSSGVAVGTSTGKDGKSVAVVYRNATLTPLAGGIAAKWIGDDGRIGGHLDDAAGGGVAVWATPDAQPVPLAGVPHGWTAHISSIAADGTVVGWATPPPLPHHPQDVENSPRGDTGYLWRPDGAMTTLPTPTLPDRKVIGFVPMSLNGDRVFGVAYVEGTSIERRLMWMDIPSPAATEYPADAQLVTGPSANIRGWFAGAIDDRLDMPPAIATPNGRLDLPTASGAAGHTALAANRDGTVIVGNAHEPTTYTGQALVWHCPHHRLRS